MNIQRAAGPMYSVPLTTTALTTANGWDVLQITANSSARFEIVAIDLSLASTQFASGSAIALQLLRGSTAASTGAALTAPNVKPWVGAPSANFTAAGPSSGLTSTASATLIWSGAFDSMGRLTYRPADRDERIAVTLAQRLNFRVGTPQIPVTITGSVLLSETGKGLPS
jgi:hypothetical protein